MSIMLQLGVAQLVVELLTEFELSDSILVQRSFLEES